MNRDEMKKLYEDDPDKWDVYFYNQCPTQEGWQKVGEHGSLSNELINYQPIAKRHSEIARAVSANPEIEVIVKENSKGLWCDVVNFFKDYSHKDIYQLKPQQKQCDGKFNNGFIVASQEAYDLLIESGYKPFSFNTKYGKDYYEVGGDDLLDNEFQRVVLLSFDKQFYINNNELSWTKPETPNKEIIKPLHEAVKASKQLEKQDTISIAEDKKAFIERDDFIVRTSSIFALAYSGGCVHLRLKNGGYINKIQMSKKEFVELKDEFKSKI